jgi:hypothetical protein
MLVRGSFTKLFNSSFSLVAITIKKVNILPVVLFQLIFLPCTLELQFSYRLYYG